MIERYASRVALAGFAATLCFGCSANRVEISGEDVHHAEIVRGEIGIRGEDNRVTLLAGSDVSKLSIVGEENKVFVEDGAIVAKIEMVGEDNEVSCPADVHPAFSAIGEGNRLKHRGRAGNPDRVD